jgi:hypothetical protein
MRLTTKGLLVSALILSFGGAAHAQGAGGGGGGTGGGTGGAGGTAGGNGAGQGGTGNGNAKWKRHYRFNVRGVGFEQNGNVIRKFADEN